MTLTNFQGCTAWKCHHRCGKWSRKLFVYQASECQQEHLWRIERLQFGDRNILYFACPRSNRRWVNFLLHCSSPGILCIYTVGILRDVIVYFARLRSVIPELKSFSYTVWICIASTSSPTYEFQLAPTSYANSCATLFGDKYIIFPRNEMWLNILLVKNNRKRSSKYTVMPCFSGGRLSYHGSDVTERIMSSERIDLTKFIPVNKKTISGDGGNSVDSSMRSNRFVKLQFHIQNDFHQVETATRINGRPAQIGLA